MLIHTLYQSLSFETILKTHATRIDAETYMAKILREYGDWPAVDAIHAARNGTPVLVRDNGDDETIEIRETSSFTGGTK